MPTPIEHEPGSTGPGPTPRVIAKQQARANAAGRLLAVLDAFTPQRRSLSLTEISRAAGLSLSTAHRLVSELANWGALERDGNGRYSIGIRLLELASLSPRGMGLRETAYPYLDELHHRTRGNVHLAVRDGLQVVYVETMCARALHPTPSHVGDRWPVHATGTGLVLLALADEDVQEQALRGPFERYTPLTITDPAQLRRMLAQVRKSRIAVTHGQITLHDLAVAVPVYDHLGEVTAAISVVVETERAKPRVLGEMLTEASRGISHLLAPRMAHRSANAARPATVSVREASPATGRRCSR